MLGRNCADLYEKYRIEAQIGRGASGICYRVQNISTKQLQVMKKIHISSIKKSSTREACLQVHILSKLNHPSIIKLHQFFTDENNIYIIMQFAPKGDLHHALKKRKILKDLYLQAQIWEMAYQLLTALQYLHNRNIIHRDVKTLNIFIDTLGKLYLGDLGVSKILKADAGLYSRVGTPLYLAPEIIKYQKYDFKADIWGLGCVCYQLATFNHPFEAKNIISLGQNIVTSQPRKIENYSNKLNQFIMDMLEKDPHRRLKASELIEKYYKSKAYTEIEDRVEVKQPKDHTINKIYGGKVNFQSQALINNKFVNNYFQQKLGKPVKELKQIKKKQIQRKTVNIVSQGRNLDQTIIFTKRNIVNDQIKNETTHKCLNPRPKTFNSQQYKIISCSQPKSEIQKQNPSKNNHLVVTSEKKLQPNRPNLNFMFQAPNISRKQHSHKTEISYIGMKRQSSGMQMAPTTKMERLRPQSGIMSKQRHESTMKNIRKYYRKAETYEFDSFIETQILKKPEMIIL